MDRHDLLLLPVVDAGDHLGGGLLFAHRPSGCTRSDKYKKTSRLLHVHAYKVQHAYVCTRELTISARHGIFCSVLGLHLRVPAFVSVRSNLWSHKKGFLFPLLFPLLEAGPLPIPVLAVLCLRFSYNTSRVQYSLPSVYERTSASTQAGTEAREKNTFARIARFCAGIRTPDPGHRKVFED